MSKDYNSYLNGNKCGRDHLKAPVSARWSPGQRRFTERTRNFLPAQLSKRLKSLQESYKKKLLCFILKPPFKFAAIFTDNITTYCDFLKSVASLLNKTTSF